MRWERPCKLALAVVALVPFLGCSARREPLATAIDRALASGTRALIAAQGPDGAWRSRTYGDLKDDPALTATVLKAIVYAPDVPGSAAARRRGAASLLTSGAAEPAFPVYAAAETAIVLTRVEIEEGGPARAATLEVLRSRQLTEDLGWSPADAAYGAWGDAIEPSRNGGPDIPAAADISSTLFALGALRICGAAADDPAIPKALQFLERCQNLAADGQDEDSAFDDGGFFFSPTDLVRNKAGGAGTDRHGRVRYHSYGSATADGLRALLRCGLPLDHPRVAAARGWLEKNFSATTNPGTFEPARLADRESTYFYYAWSLAHAFRALGGRMSEGEGRETAWAELLSKELIRRQRGDGTWSNGFTASKEDDPLVATPLALGALGLCRAFVMTWSAERR